MQNHASNSKSVGPRKTNVCVLALLSVLCKGHYPSHFKKEQLVL